MLIARFQTMLPAGVPEWVHLLPAGTFTALIDGQPKFCVADPEAVIRASMADGRSLPVDENHSTDYAAKAGFEAPARGRIVELQSRADGIWGRVEWNDAGRGLIEQRAYDSMSAVVLPAADGTITRILRAALTNDPAVPGLQTLFHNPENEMDLAAIRLALGLPDTADEGACLDAARAARQAREASAQQLGTFAAAAGLTGAVTAEQIVAALRGGSNQVATLAATVTRLEAELTTERATRLHAEATAFIDAAIKDGKPVLALRDHLIKRFAADPDAVKLEVGKLPSITNPTGQGNPGGPAPAQPIDPATVTLSASDNNVIALMGLDPEVFKKSKAARLAEQQKKRAA